MSGGYAGASGTRLVPASPRYYRNSQPKWAASDAWGVQVSEPLIEEPRHWIGRAPGCHVNAVRS